MRARRVPAGSRFAPTRRLPHGQEGTLWAREVALGDDLTVGEGPPHQDVLVHRVDIAEESPEGGDSQRVTGLVRRSPGRREHGLDSRERGARGETEEGEVAQVEPREGTAWRVDRVHQRSTARLDGEGAEIEADGCRS